MVECGSALTCKATWLLPQSVRGRYDCVTKELVPALVAKAGGGPSSVQSEEGGVICRYISTVVLGSYRLDEGVVNVPETSRNFPRHF